MELEDVEAAVQRWAAYVDTLQATKCVGSVGVGADVCTGTVPQGLEAEPEPEESAVHLTDDHTEPSPGADVIGMHMG